MAAVAAEIAYCRMDVLNASWSNVCAAKWLKAQYHVVAIFGSPATCH
jgi:hypothetical protein